MKKRFVTIWFPSLRTDWFAKRHQLPAVPFVLTSKDHGRMIISTANHLAIQAGIYNGMTLADARAIFPSLRVMDDQPLLSARLLNKLAEWCILFTPVVSVDLPEGLILDVTGCAHLWGSEKIYLENIVDRLSKLKYQVRIAMADTIGCAWAFSRLGNDRVIVEPGAQLNTLISLPAAALRLESETLERLQKLGLRKINDFIAMPRSTLRRRFGIVLLKRLDQALGHEEEFIDPVVPVVPYQERLPSPDPIITVTGIEIALQRMLDKICDRLLKEQKGLRKACLKCYCTDSRIVSIEIGTNKPSHNIQHLFKLFALKIENLAPGPGIELFILEAYQVEDAWAIQENLWERPKGLEAAGLSEFLDRVKGKIATVNIHRYVPDEHYWPERSVKLASSLAEQAVIPWRTDKPRPIHLLARPELISVTAPIPDYPPMLFRYKNKLHKIIKADGPERIEQEWWLQEGEHRDYYYVEDEEGQRYWLFRLGHYTIDKKPQWFIHGFFS